MMTKKTPKPRKPNAPDVSLHFKVYQGTGVRVIPGMDGLKCVLVNKDHPQYGQPGGSQYYFTDHQGARIDGANKAILTWEMIDQLCHWRDEMLKWQTEMRQWCLDNGVALQESENEA